MKTGAKNPPRKFDAVHGFQHGFQHGFYFFAPPKFLGDDKHTASKTVYRLRHRSQEQQKKKEKKRKKKNVKCYSLCPLTYVVTCVASNLISALETS